MKQQFVRNLKYFMDFQTWAENTPYAVFRMKIDTDGISIKINVHDEFEYVLRDVTCLKTAYLKMLTRYREYERIS
jgi:hypothetical protein